MIGMRARSFDLNIIIFFISDARGCLLGRPPNSGSRHLQPEPDDAARRACQSIINILHSATVKPVPATVHMGKAAGFSMI